MVDPMIVEEEATEGWFDSIGLGDDPVLPAALPEGLKKIR